MAELDDIISLKSAWRTCQTGVPPNETQACGHIPMFEKPVIFPRDHAERVTIAQIGELDDMSDVEAGSAQYFLDLCPMRHS